MGMSHEIRIFHSLKCFTIDVVMPPPPSCSIILPTISVIKEKIIYLPRLFFLLQSTKDDIWKIIDNQTVMPLTSIVWTQKNLLFCSTD